MTQQVIRGDDSRDPDPIIGNKAGQSLPFAAGKNDTNRLSFPSGEGQQTTADLLALLPCGYLTL